MNEYTVQQGDTLTLGQLSEIMPRARQADLEKYLEPLNTQLPQFDITPPLRKAHFIAQVAHESGNFHYSEENLNYSASALRSVFGKYFPTDEAAGEYARKPEKIAGATMGTLPIYQRLAAINHTRICLPIMSCNIS